MEVPVFIEEKIPQGIMLTWNKIETELSHTFLNEFHKPTAWKQMTDSDEEAIRLSPHCEELCVKPRNTMAPV